MVDLSNKNLYEHYAFDVDKGQEPLRVDKYLMNFLQNATRNKIQLASFFAYISIQ